MEEIQAKLNRRRLLLLVPLSFSLWCLSFLPGPSRCPNCGKGKLERHPGPDGYYDSWPNCVTLLWRHRTHIRMFR